MNKKKIVFSSLAVLMMFSSVLLMPVMAEPTKGQKVAVTSVFVAPPQVPSMGELVITNGGIYILKDFVEVWSNNLLFIDDNPVPLHICAYMVESGSWNSKTRVCVLHDDVVWYVSEEGSPDGFAGTEILKLFDYDFLGTHRWTSMQMHAVYHGFGAFEGQTLTFFYAGPASPVSTGYLLKG